MLVLPLVAMLQGCGEAAGPFVPLEGTWETISASVVDDGCNFFGDDLDDPAGLPDGYEVGDVSADGFTLLGDEENDVQDCALASSSFECDPYTETESGSQAGGSYTVTSIIQTTGTLTSDHTMSLQISMDVDCTGSMCDDVAEYFETSFPCATVASQELQAPVD